MMIKRFLKRKQSAGSALMFVKKEILSRWNAAAKVTSDLYMNNVQLNGLAWKGTKTVMFVDKKF